MKAYVGVKKGKVLGNLDQCGSLLLVVGFDHERRLAGGLLVFLGLTLDEPSHIRDRVLGRVPGPVDFIGGACEVVVRVPQRHLSLVWFRADQDRLSPHGPVGVGVLVAEGLPQVGQVIDPRMEGPVSGDVVEGVVLHHEVDNMLDLGTRHSEHRHGDRSIHDDYFLTFFLILSQALLALGAGSAAPAAVKAAMVVTAKVDFIVPRYSGGMLSLLCRRLVSSCRSQAQPAIL